MAVVVEEVVARLRADSAQFERSFKRAERVVGQSTNKMKRDAAGAARSFDGVTQAVGRFRGGIAAIGGVLAGIGLVRFVRALVDTRLEIERINNALRLATGDAALAKSAFAFVSDEATRLGLNLQVAARNFAQLSAAARGTTLEGQATRDIFSAVGSAAVVMGLSISDQEGVFRAIQQIISKGTVQAEELRGQLGERLPGAFQLAARALGTTTAGLGKMLEQGQVLADDLLPKLAIEMERVFGPEVEDATETTRAAIGRFQTELFKFLDELGTRTGIVDAFTESLEGLTEVLKNLTEASRETRKLDLARTVREGVNFRGLRGRKGPLPGSEGARAAALEELLGFSIGSPRGVQAAAVRQDASRREAAAQPTEAERKAAEKAAKEELKFANARIFTAQKRIEQLREETAERQKNEREFFDQLAREEAGLFRLIDAQSRSTFEREKAAQALELEAELKKILNRDLNPEELAALETKAERLVTLQRELEKTVSVSEQLEETLRDVAVSGAEELGAAIFDVADGTKTAEDALRDFARTAVRELAEVIFKMTILADLTRALGGEASGPGSSGFLASLGGLIGTIGGAALFSGGGGGGGGFLDTAATRTSLPGGIGGNQGGGRVASGVPRLVGELRPEIFTPDQPGRISARGGSSTGQTVIAPQTNLNVATGVSETVRAEISAMLPELESRSVAAMLKVIGAGGNEARQFNLRR